ncbi:MAG: type II toxin-antitoxin system RelE/ParE family toxin [Stenomitos rutilans HA7619-LM2]|jgi:plasmid stabilization system protein ParE|nr:type II toxin-antitoxin system RelE/ParE family toxin [Stenomitos rutilans HA7619-LM2]
MYAVTWLEEASQDVFRHYEFLSAKNQPAAIRAVQAILEAGESLQTSPYRGTVLRSRPHIRWVRVFFGKYGYILHYRVEEDTVIILEVYDGREDRAL